MDDETNRFALHTRLREVLGDETADTLMRSLPPTPGHDVATKDDLAELARREDLDRLAVQIRGEIAESKGGIRGDIAEVRGEIMRTEARLATQVAQQTRLYMFATVGAVLTTGALAFAAAGLA